MRIDYTQFPLVDNYSNVRYITDSFTDCMKKCEKKLMEFSFNIDSQNVVYIYRKFFIVCKFNSLDGWVNTATIKVYRQSELVLDIFYDNTWKARFNETERAFTYMCAAFTFFIENAEVETIHLNKKSGINHFNVKYSNDTNRNIKIFDSKWLRTIVMGDAFGVRGHFRFQPYGDNKRKLIWIDDFVKNGYTRKAGILKDN